MANNISIIIPTLNEEKLLPKLLKQVSDKKLKEQYNIEIIASDGGSTDKTLEVAKNFADKILEHVNGRQQNIAEGRNLGAAAANGEILVFLNGDTRIENTELFFRHIDNKFINSKYLAMTCNVDVFPEESKFIDNIFTSFYNNYFHLLNIIGLGMGRGECHIISKKVFDDFGGYNINLAAGEDFDLYKRIRKKGKILFDRKLTVYESPRRYRKYGHFRILFTWLINSISVFFMNKSISKNWEEVR